MRACVRAYSACVDACIRVSILRRKAKETLFFHCVYAIRHCQVL